MRVDIDRLMGRIDQLAQIGAIEGTRGNSRLALTDSDRDGRNLVRSWMEDLGLHVTVDAIGNVVGCTHSDSASSPPVMAGSHIDTVATGGRYDGVLGVLAGLEVIECLQGVELKRPLAVGFFTDEEGSRFQPDMLGSLVYVGGIPLAEALSITDADSITVGDELDRIGYRGSAPIPGPVPHAFVELHIEQGPVLEAEGVTIGVVEGVQGISWTELTIEGQSNHAGTTPMNMRRDPGVVAARIAVAARETAHGNVATVGSIRFQPDLVNVVPAQVTMTLDLRHADETVLRTVEQEMFDFVDQAARDEGVKVSTRQMARFEPVVFDTSVAQLIEDKAKALGLSTRRIASGAGHDAQMMARVCPTAMIFVPSVQGLSHNPAEHTNQDDIEAGANVLLATMAELAS